MCGVYGNNDSLAAWACGASSLCILGFLDLPCGHFWISPRLLHIHPAESVEIDSVGAVQRVTIVLG